MTTPSERIRLGDHYYLLASALAPRGRRLILNDGNTFAIFDEAGDIPLASRDTMGLFCRGTRFTARLELRIDGTFPFLLSAGWIHDGSELVVHLTNPDQRRDGELIVQRDSVALQRHIALVDGMLSQSIALDNYSTEAVELTLEVQFAVDFADIFELRGAERTRYGKRAPPQVGHDSVVFGYRGLDGVERRSEFRFTSRWHVGADRATIDLALQPGEQTSLGLRVDCHVGHCSARGADFDAGLAKLRSERDACAHAFARIESNNDAFNDWIDGSLRDLAILSTETSVGTMVYAGIPWFATIFGRDGLITAFETLAFNPNLAAGVLRNLAALQGRTEDAPRGEEPGKILHEARDGEMAATGEVPFGRYYGSIDATPLFLCLLAAYSQRTGDLDVAQELWPAACAALEWVDGSVDRRGYLAYELKTERGLVNQGWKDSHDSISHRDGTLAHPPIALCEVQGYVYAARHGMALLARRLGVEADTDGWTKNAELLRQRFAEDFWMEDEQCYALALDRDGRPCRTVTSNAGHCLLTGIADSVRAGRVVDRLMRSDCFCGWGIRTLSSKEKRYNPMSYHNGSIWPHDNALIAAGFALYGRRDASAALLGALFAASVRQEDRRLPELFCGFPRSRFERPVSYPVACRPQAWAAASVFLLLQSALGLNIDGWNNRVTFSGAVVPEWLDYVDIRGLRVGDQSLDVRIRRGRRASSIEILEKSGDIEVLVRK